MDFQRISKILPKLKKRCWPVMRVSHIVRKLQTGEQGNEEDSKDMNDPLNTSERDSVNKYVSSKVTEKSIDSVKAVISDFIAESDIFKDDRGCRTVLYPIKDSFKVKDDSLNEIIDISTQKDNTQYTKVKYADECLERFKN